MHHQIQLEWQILWKIHLAKKKPRLAKVTFFFCSLLFLEDKFNKMESSVTGIFVDLHPIYLMTDWTIIYIIFTIYTLTCIVICFIYYYFWILFPFNSTILVGHWKDLEVPIFRISSGPAENKINKTIWIECSQSIYHNKYQNLFSYLYFFFFFSSLVSRFGCSLSKCCCCFSRQTSFWHRGQLLPQVPLHSWLPPFLDPLT